MYIAMSVIFTAGTLFIFFIGLYQEKRKEIERLQTQIREQEERHGQCNADTQENIKIEKKRRDLTEIYLVTDAKPNDCENIYSALIESEKYGDFFYSANTKKQKLRILKDLKLIP